MISVFQDQAILSERPGCRPLREEDSIAAWMNESELGSSGERGDARSRTRGAA
jgi:hypothetical protein